MISRQSAHEVGKVSLTHQPPLPLPLPPINIPGTYFCLRLSRRQVVHVLRPEIPKTPSGIEPVTFEFVVQRLNQLFYHVPPHP
jgi:hypothetical protein